MIEFSSVGVVFKYLLVSDVIIIGLMEEFRVNIGVGVIFDDEIDDILE